MHGGSFDPPASWRQLRSSAGGKQEAAKAAIPGRLGKINWKQFAGTSITVLNLNYCL